MNHLHFLQSLISRHVLPVDHRALALWSRDYRNVSLCLAFSWISDLLMSTVFSFCLNCFRIFFIARNCKWQTISQNNIFVFILERHFQWTYNSTQAVLFFQHRDNITELSSGFRYCCWEISSVCPFEGILAFPNFGLKHHTDQLIGLLKCKHEVSVSDFLLSYWYSICYPSWIRRLHL